jgi:hypothetical protein
MRCEEEELLIWDTYRDLGLDGSFESVLGDDDEVCHLALLARVGLSGRKMYALCVGPYRASSSGAVLAWGFLVVRHRGSVVCALETLC